MPKSVFTDAYVSMVDDLVALRKQSGVSQVELAQRLGKTQQFVSSVEQRIRRLDVIELYAYVRAIGGNPEGVVVSLFRRLPSEISI